MATIYTANTDDCKALAKLHARSFAAGQERQWNAKDFKDSLESYGTRCFLLKSDENITAFLSIRVVFEEAEIILLGVDPDYQRQGYASQLVRHAIEAMKQAGVTRIILEVREDNYAAMRLYTAFGFEEVGLRKAYYHLSNGERKNAIIFLLNTK